MSEKITIFEGKTYHCRYGSFLLAWSKLSAIIGGLLLLSICIISILSILGRWLFNTPITGDIELVQITCSLSIASFLPYAQMKNAHVIVDFFTHNTSPRNKFLLDTLATVLLAIISCLLAWRSAEGAFNTYRYKTTTMILGLPEWIAHLTISPAFVLLALTALYTGYNNMIQLRRK